MVFLLSIVWQYTKLFIWICTIHWTSTSNRTYSNAVSSYKRNGALSIFFILMMKLCSSSTIKQILCKFKGYIRYLWIMELGCWLRKPHNNSLSSCIWNAIWRCLLVHTTAYQHHNTVYDPLFKNIIIVGTVPVKKWY